MKKCIHLVMRHIVVSLRADLYHHQVSRFNWNNYMTICSNTLNMHVNAYPIGGMLEIWYLDTAVWWQLTQLTWFTNPTMHLFTQCTIQNRHVHISIQNGDMGQVHCGIYKIGLFPPRDNTHTYEHEMQATKSQKIQRNIRRFQLYCSLLSLVAGRFYT